MLTANHHIMDPATAVGFYAAIISVAETIKKYAIDDDGGMLQSLEDLKTITKLTQDTLYRISNQISSFSRELSGSTLQINNEHKYDQLSSLPIFIKSEINYLVSTAPSSKSSPEVISSYFNDFIVKFQRENPDYKMLDLLEDALPGSQSFLKVFIEKFQYNQQRNIVGLKTSTNKMVYELFTVIGYYIGQAHLLMNLCILIRKHYSPSNVDYEDQNYLNSRIDVQTRFTNIMKRTLMAVDHYDDYVLHMELNQHTTNVNKIAMKNVLQNYLEYEPRLSKENYTCSGVCEDYLKSEINGGDGCYGELRDCRFKVPLYNVGYTTRTNDPTSRIYNGYGISPDWYGFGGFEDTPEMFDFLFIESISDDKWVTNGRKASISKLIYNCHSCLCTCDNFNSVHTIRRFYAGEMKPQIPGYVITGVRFLEKNHVIFLQIQVGKLLPYAIIDESTVQWMDVPQDIGSNYIEFGFDFRKFSLDGILIRDWKKYIA